MALVVPSNVKLTKGVALFELDMQKYPALQGPLTAVRPSIAQYIPPVQGEQAVDETVPALALKVPMEQGRERTDPTGQY